MNAAEIADIDKIATNTINKSLLLIELIDIPSVI
jgi:hypothetical protein